MICFVRTIAKPPPVDETSALQVPPSVPGLIAALESKYKISASNIRYLYRKTKLGVLAKIDDDMLRFYSNEDVFLMQVPSQIQCWV